MSMIQNLKRLREKAGISQQKLAVAVGVSQQSINKYENHDIEPDIRTLIAIAEYFNTSVDYLIGHTEIDHVMEAVTPYDLNEEEIAVIKKYRLLTYGEKESVRLILENYCK